jgi:hypothetical protein
MTHPIPPVDSQAALEALDKLRKLKFESKWAVAIKDKQDAILRAFIQSRASMDQKPVGVAGSMPGTSGFTMAAFEADKVPIGTPLFTAPVSPSVGDGWQLVPVEPTPEMLRKGCEAGLSMDALLDDGRFACERRQWGAMLAASPRPAEGWRPIETEGDQNASEN